MIPIRKVWMPCAGSTGLCRSGLAALVAEHLCARYVCSERSESKAGERAVDQNKTERRAKAAARTTHVKTLPTHRTTSRCAICIRLAGYGPEGHYRTVSGTLTLRADFARDLG